jgi:glutathione S-transferase
MELGGFKAAEYLSINPQGKVPSFYSEANDLKIAESDVICRYLLSTYSHRGPSFQPNNPRSNQIARFHDMYLTTIQSCLYRAVPPFGSFGSNRRDAIQEYSKQLYVIADLMENDDTTYYMCGNDVSLADATVFPSIVFASYMFPKFDLQKIFGDVDQPPIPPKIQNWYQRMIETDGAFQKVYEEVSQSR